MSFSRAKSISRSSSKAAAPVPEDPVEELPPARKRSSKNASGAAALPPVPDLPAVLEKKASSKRTKSKGSQPAAATAEAHDQAPSSPAPSASAKRKTRQILTDGLNGDYWTGKKVPRKFHRTISAYVPSLPGVKKHVRAKPIAGGLRKGKPSYLKMVTLALKDLGKTLSANGHSSGEIQKWIEARYPVPDNSTRHIRAALTRAQTALLISRVGQRYRLRASASSAKKHSTKKTAASSSSSLGSGSKKATKKTAGHSAPSKRSKLSERSTGAVMFGPPAIANVDASHGAAFQKAFVWQYKDNAGRWSNYDAPASDTVEGCYEEFVANPNMMDVRAVKSGEWMYQVDFQQMKQTNIQHEAHRVRDIRRVPIANK